MDYAGIIGQNFEIPLQQQVVPQVAPANPMATAQKGDAPGVAMEKDLYEVEGLTKEYYDKWTALNQWSEEMQSMGINVTKPDPMNPSSQAAHRWFLKAVADLQRHGQSLKHQSEVMKSYADARKSNSNITLGGKDGTKQLITEMDIQNLSETDMVKRINTDLAKSSNDPAEYKALQKQIEGKRALLEQELAEMLQNGAPEQAVQAKANEINQLNDATYNDTTRWQERQQNARAKIAKEEKPTDYTRVELVQRIKDGDLSILKSNKNVTGVQEVNDPRQQGLMVTYKDGHTAFIDFKDKENIDLQINSALNDGGEGTPVSVDQYYKLMQSYPQQLSVPKTVDTTDGESAFLSALESAYPATGQATTDNKSINKRRDAMPNSFETRRAAVTALKQAAPSLTIPASEFELSRDRYVGKVDITDNGVIKFQLVDDKDQTQEKVEIDMKTPEGKAKMQAIISANPGVLDLKQFMPDPLQKELRFNNNFPEIGGTQKVSPIVAGQNRSDVL